MKKKPIGEGYFLNDMRAQEVGADQTVVHDVFVLSVEGGQIYYRDVVVHRGDKIVHMTQTSNFVPDVKCSTKKS